MTNWQNKPFPIKVKSQDRKIFCMCGLSQNGPYCDGSHKSTHISPQIVTFEKDATIYACGCGKSKKRPYCDGSHQEI